MSKVAQYMQPPLNCQERKCGKKNAKANVANLYKNWSKGVQQICILTATFL